MGSFVDLVQTAWYLFHTRALCLPDKVAPVTKQPETVFIHVAPHSVVRVDLDEDHTITAMLSPAFTLPH